jgi:dGTPase
MRREASNLSKSACLSSKAVRRLAEKNDDHRLSFSIDCDRILHSKAYTRYIDKTQVFYMVSNDHITHRVLHVQLVSKIARTIGRFLYLNEDLIEAIALGHDLGHPPFGHDGESILSEICIANNLPAFLHNVQSIRFLESLEKKGRGLNLTLQTLDGILCHDGEALGTVLTPTLHKTFATFDTDYQRTAEDPTYKTTPMTLEGCVVRLSDTIAYIGRDIEDAIELNLITRDQIPQECTEILGRTNGTIVYRLVTDLIKASTDSSIQFSAKISEVLRKLKKFNYEHIYLNPTIKSETHKIKKCYQVLFDTYMNHLESADSSSLIMKDFVNYLDPHILANNAHASIVRDFIAGMTDDYFLTQAKLLNCPLPQKNEI